MFLSVLLITSLALSGAIAAPQASVPLQNAAQPGQTMPWIGLGTGGYSPTKVAYGAYPECWMEVAGCGPYTQQAVSQWLAAGGRRLDTANSYDTQESVGAAMYSSGVPRKDIFLLQKIGNWNAMGYNDTFLQMDLLLQLMNVTYVDLLLNHWPTGTTVPTQDPTCYYGKPSYDAKECRLNTWRAMVVLFNQKKALSIGVANYNASQLQEIIDAGLPLPSVNQIPYHLYTAAAQQDTLAWCKQHNIVVLAYSPMGIPDWHKYPSQMPSTSTLTDPVLLEITAKHPGATPGQMILQWLWQQGIPSNPRSQNPTHMAQNLAAIDGSIVLTPQEMQQLNTRPVDSCEFDPDFYECIPTATHPTPRFPRH